MLLLLVGSGMMLIVTGISSADSGGTQPPIYVWAQGPGGEKIISLYFDSNTQTMWGTRGPNSNELYKSTDSGATWALVYSFPYRVKYGQYWYKDMVYAIQVLDTGTILVSVGPGDVYNGTIYRSTDGGATFTRAKYANGIGFPDNTDFQYIRGVSNQWAFDHNGKYAVAGTYTYKDSTGMTDRDVWMSTDDGATWNRAFHIEGNGSVNAFDTHVHMARIDPDGGCWISIGDHDPGWSHDNQTYGLWYSPGQPQPISGEPTTDNWGSFTRIYNHAASNRWARIRPVSVIFKSLPTGEKYAYLGEDDMTGNEARTITRLRYDDLSYTTEVKANFTQPFGDPPPNYNGGIFGMTEITPDYWVAAAVSLPNTNPPSEWALLYTTDGGEHWDRDPNATLPGHFLMRDTAGGRVWGGRPVDDQISWGFRPTTWPGFSADRMTIDQGQSVSFSDTTVSPTTITSWDWDFGDGQTGSGKSPVHAYGGSGTFTATLTVHEQDGGSATSSKTIDVRNLTPSVGSCAFAPAYSNQPVDLSCPFSDPGSLDTHSATIDWGDGTVQTNAAVTEYGGSGILTGSHTYDNPGGFTATVTLTDNGGAASTATAPVNVEAGCTRPELRLASGAAYWQSYSAYLARQLTKPYTITNASGAGMGRIDAVGSLNTNGVMAYTSLPMNLAPSLAGNGTVSYSLDYLVPGPVTSFRTITYVTVEDHCGNMYYYPGPYFDNGG